YPSREAWTKEYQRLSGKTSFERLQAYQGSLQKGVDELFACLELWMTLDRQLSKLYTYAHLKHDEDVAKEEPKQDYGSIRFLVSEFYQSISWIEPEILQIPQERLQKFLQDPKLEKYKVFLERIIRLQPYTLSAREEKLLSLASKALQAPSLIFSSYNNADAVFGEIEDSQGHKRPLSLGSYQLYLQSQDRKLRKNAFHRLHEEYKRHENSLTEMLQGQVQATLFRANARGYNTCLAASLFPKEIEVSVYTSLVKALRQRRSVLHDYIAWRKEVLKVDLVHGYDMSVAPIGEVNIRMTFDEAVELLLEAIKPLGCEYRETLEKGIKEQGWVDRYESVRKRSGAYSSGCYDSYPYILLNYQGTLSDVMTLAHEAGHSMHSYLSRKNQPYHYSDYTIFVAEVASTFNEELVFRLLLEKAKTREEKLFLLNTKIDGIRATLFRQTLFAEFELAIHTLAEKGEPLTPEKLKAVYKKLNKEYYGEAFCHDDAIEYECFRIPHFYSSFYVYQYATGISAAHSLVEKVLKDGDASSYLAFLSSGCLRDPVALLKGAGVDMSTEAPIEAILQRFQELHQEMRQLFS
ncbi:MAG: oligoendopeptidase F, partial [Chlamydiae bacterium]|nr:oligoendopeptidase F [Chlamydiota bacterium]